MIILFKIFEVGKKMCRSPPPPPPPHQLFQDLRDFRDWRRQLRDTPPLSKHPGAAPAFKCTKCDGIACKNLPGGGGGVLTPNFGRYVQRQSEKLARAPELA